MTEVQKAVLEKIETLSQEARDNVIPTINTIDRWSGWFTTIQFWSGFGMCLSVLGMFGCYLGDVANGLFYPEVELALAIKLLPLSGLVLTGVICGLSTLLCWWLTETRHELLTTCNAAINIKDHAGKLGA